jgi:hypothetical protein
MGWPQPRPEAVERATAWLREHDATFHAAVLRQRLREQGYEEPEIDAALAIRRAEIEASSPVGADLRGRAAAILIVAFLATWGAIALILTRPVGGGLQFGGAAATILGMVLAPLLLVSLIGVARSGRLRRGSEGALALLAIPFVLLVIVAGLCVVTTNGLRV